MTRNRSWEWKHRCSFFSFFTFLNFFYPCSWRRFGLVHTYPPSLPHAPRSLLGSCGDGLIPAVPSLTDVLQKRQSAFKIYMYPLVLNMAVRQPRAANWSQIFAVTNPPRNQSPSERIPSRESSLMTRIKWEEKADYRRYTDRRFSPFPQMRVIPCCCKE